MWRAMKPRAPKWIVDAGNRPCPGRRVHAPGDQQVWVCRAERHAVHVVRVTNECLDALPSFNVPDLCRLVVASGGEQGRASRAESDAAYSICVFFQRLDAFKYVCTCQYSRHRKESQSAKGVVSVQSIFSWDGGLHGNGSGTAGSARARKRLTRTAKDCN